MNKTLRLLGAGALIFAGSCLGGYVSEQIREEPLEDRIERITEEKIKNIRLQTRIVLPSGIEEELTIPDSFSRQEKFHSDEPNYWRGKLGFKYEVENLEYSLREGFPENSRIGLAYNGTGVKFGYTVKEFSLGIDETLTLYNYNNNVSPDSYVIVSDSNHDSIPDRIYIIDEKNNTQVHINRNEEGVLETSDCDEETARQLFDLYTFKFQNFQREHNIRERIGAYERKMEIVETEPDVF
ncbi:MAG: hypothetical protein KKG75_04185 [Nanoarchaeota archaeon]|nr:hypothetical protein [Nanoarchaeota archaeon]